MFKMTMAEFENRFLDGDEWYGYFSNNPKYYLIEQGQDEPKELTLSMNEDSFKANWGNEDEWEHFTGTELLNYEDGEVIPENKWRNSFNLVKIEKSFGGRDMIFLERG
jgi:hypothetical protein